MRGKRFADRSSARAQVIRVLMDELTRIASHQLWWGAMAMDVGAFTPFFHAFRERETINDIMEETCGARFTMNYMVPGGVMVDLHPDFQERVKEFIQFLRSKIDEYDELVTGNIIFQNRMEGRGLSLAGRCRFLMVARGRQQGAAVLVVISENCILMKFMGIWHFEEILETGGDSFARYLVRMKEMRQSVAIIEQLIDNIPEGDFQAKTKAVLKLPKGEFYQQGRNGAG